MINVAVISSKKMCWWSGFDDKLLVSILLVGKIVISREVPINNFDEAVRKDKLDFKLETISLNGFREKKVSEKWPKIDLISFWDNPS